LVFGPCVILVRRRVAEHRSTNWLLEVFVRSPSSRSPATCCGPTIEDGPGGQRRRAASRALSTLAVRRYVWVNVAHRTPSWSSRRCVTTWSVLGGALLRPPVRSKQSA